MFRNLQIALFASLPLLPTAHADVVIGGGEVQITDTVYKDGNLVEKLDANGKSIVLFKRKLGPRENGRARRTHEYKASLSSNLGAVRFKVLSYQYKEQVHRYRHGSTTVTTPFALITVQVLDAKSIHPSFEKPRELVVQLQPYDRADVDRDEFFATLEEWKKAEKVVKAKLNLNEVIDYFELRETIYDRGGFERDPETIYANATLKADWNFEIESIETLNKEIYFLHYVEADFKDLARHSEKGLKPLKN